MTYWWYNIPQEDIDAEIARYRATLKGKHDTRSDEQLAGLAVNEIVARRGPRLADRKETQ